MGYAFRLTKEVFIVKQLADKREREKDVVCLMIRLHCEGRHGEARAAAGTPKGELCPECAELAAHACGRVDRCPFMETKTFCSNCRVHCYKPEMRERIREVMRYSGPRMIYHHPVMAVRHLIESWREKRRQVGEQGA